MDRVARTVITLALAAIPVAAAASQVSTPAPAASLAGKWTITVKTPAGARPSQVELKVDSKDATKLTGTITTMVSTDPIEGEVVDGTLTLRLSSIDPSGKAALVTFVGTVQKDGSLAGTLNAGPGNVMPWTATREPKKS